MKRHLSEHSSFHLEYPNGEITFVTEVSATLTQINIANLKPGRTAYVISDNNKYFSVGTFLGSHTLMTQGIVFFHQEGDSDLIPTKKLSEFQRI